MKNRAEEIILNRLKKLEYLPLHLLAYYTAKFFGRNIDRPRNLAKSVTVE
jgi:hypothetical protein